MCKCTILTWDCLALGLYIPYMCRQLHSLNSGAVSPLWMEDCWKYELKIKKGVCLFKAGLKPGLNPKGLILLNQDLNQGYIIEN